MATPVKTLLLNAITVAITNISGIKTVIARKPFTPDGKNQYALPLVVMMDGEEEVIQVRNRVTIKRFPLYIRMWFQENPDDLSSTGDIWQADIEKALDIFTTQVPKYSKGIFPDGADIDYADDNLGDIMLRFQVTYMHKTGDPYDTATS